jgi:hypothetical protein
VDQKGGKGRFGSGLKSIRGASFRNGPIRMGASFQNCQANKRVNLLISIPSALNIYDREVCRGD